MVGLHKEKLMYLLSNTFRIVVQSPRHCYKSASRFLILGLAAGIIFSLKLVLLELVFPTRNVYLPERVLLLVVA